MNGSDISLGGKSDVVVRIPLEAFCSPLSTPSNARMSSYETSFLGLYAFTDPMILMQPTPFEQL